jgi:maltoporin
MTKKIEFTKYIKDGKVAVLVSHGFGAGWSTWAYDNDPDVRDGLMFDAVLVEHMLAGDLRAAFQYASDKYNAYTGGIENLTVHWVPQGEQFEITEYDGAESLRIISECKFHTA